MGAIFNAQANHSPLLITAGQQARAQITLQANLTNRDATRMPHPLVKWSYEPPRAEDVPLALAHGAHLAGAAAARPGLRLAADGRLVRRGRRGRRRAPRSSARSTGRAVADPEAVRALAERLDAAANPVLVAGPDIDATGAWDAAVALAERQRLPVWASPGDRRRPPRLPREPPELPRRPAAGDRPGRADARGPRPDPRRRQLGLPLLPAHPRAAAARGGEAGRDHQRPRRGGAGADGRRDRRRRRASPWRRCSRRCPSPSRPAPEPNPGPQEIPADRPAQPLDRPHRPRPRSCPRTRSSSSSRPPAPWRCATSCASRGPAATTSAPAAASASASPPRSACSSPSPTARSSACSARARPSTRSPPSGAPSPTRSRSPSWSCSNSEYAILKWFAEVEQVSGAPGLDLPELDVAAVAEGYGVKAHRAERARRGPRRPQRRARLLAAGAGRSPGRPGHVPLLSGTAMALLRAQPQSLAPHGRRAGARPRPRRARRRRRRSRCAASWRRCSAPTASSPGPATSSATPPTPAPTGSSRRRW